MTFDEAKPYMEHRSRQTLFREAVLQFMGAGGKSGEEEENQHQKDRQAYCSACRSAGLSNCHNCNPDTIGTLQ